MIFSFTWPSPENPKLQPRCRPGVIFLSCEDLPVSSAMVQVRFTRGAERAREEQEVADASGGPLQGHGLYLHSLQGSRQSSNVPALRKLILALGGKVQAHSCCPGACIQYYLDESHKLAM